MFVESRKRAPYISLKHTTEGERSKVWQHSGTTITLIRTWSLVTHRSYSCYRLIGFRLISSFISYINLQLKDFYTKLVHTHYFLGLYFDLKIYNYIFWLITVVPFKIDLKSSPRSAFVFINTSSAR